VWKAVDDSGDEEFVGTDRKDGGEKWRATRTDLVFGSNSSCARWPRSMPRRATRRSS
jgi:catalase (peroxidase I)